MAFPSLERLGLQSFKAVVLGGSASGPRSLWGRRVSSPPFPAQVARITSTTVLPLSRGFSGNGGNREGVKKNIIIRAAGCLGVLALVSYLSQLLQNRLNTSSLEITGSDIEDVTYHREHPKN
jgi:hypothetical protein